MKTIHFFLIFCLTVQCAFGQFRMKKATDAGSSVVKAATLSDEEVIALCQQYAAHLDEKNPVAPDNNKYAIRLKKLTDKHINTEELGSDVKLNFKVYLVVDVNAFALADGNVRVFAGLMDIMTDDELLGVIGHEIGHVKYKHTKKRIRTAYMTVAAKDAASAGSRVAAGLSDSDLGKFGEALVNAQFSQGQEKESDDYGLNFLHENGYDVNAMPAAFRKLAALGSGGGTKVLSSHPDPEKRAKRMESAIKKLK